MADYVDNFRVLDEYIAHVLHGCGEGLDVDLLFDAAQTLAQDVYFLPELNRFAHGQRPLGNGFHKHQRVALQYGYVYFIALLTLHQVGSDRQRVRPVMDGPHFGQNFLAPGSAVQPHRGLHLPVDADILFGADADGHAAECGDGLGADRRVGLRHPLHIVA